MEPNLLAAAVREIRRKRVSDIRCLGRDFSGVGALEMIPNSQVEWMKRDSI